MNLVQSLFDRIELGKEGLVSQVPLIHSPANMRLSKLGTRTYINKGIYVLLGGEAGSYKTSFVDATFVLNIILNYIHNGGMKPHIIYRSMERDIKFKLAKWLAYLMYWYGKELIDTATILQLTNKTRELTDKDISNMKSYEKMLEEILSYIDFVEGDDSSAGLKEYALNTAMQKGKLWEADLKYIYINKKRVQSFSDQQFETRNDVKVLWREVNGRKIYQKSQFFVDDDPNTIMIHITDHIQRVRDEGKSDRKTLDNVGEVSAFLKDTIKMLVVDISQFNRGTEDTTRRIKTNLKLSRADFRGSDTPYHHADLVIGLLNPIAKDRYQYEGYNLRPMNNLDKATSRFMSCQIIKNTYGPAPFLLGTGVLGECGAMVFLPKPKELTDEMMEEIRKGNLYFI